MAHYFPGTAGEPARLRKLTPMQFDALDDATEQLAKAGA